MTSSVVALGELFLVGSSKRVLKSQWQSNGVPFYRGREVTKLATDGVVDNELFISEALYAEFASKSGVPSAGDIMVTAIGTIGNSYVVNEGDRFYFKDASVLWLKKRSEVSSEFINLWLKSDQFFSQIDRGNGATVDTLTIQKMQSMVVCLPPLSEQRRIVAILDEAFEAIATAKANAEKNLQNARELFASRMQVLFGQSDVWERVQLEELLARGWITSHLDGNHGSDYPRKEEFVDAGVPYIAASAIKGGFVNFDEAKYLSHQRAATIRKGLAKDRDVLFAHNATVGPVAILSTDEDVVILGTSLTYYRCDPKRIHPEYLAHFMVSPAFTSQYVQVMKQSTRNQVPITKQREFFHVIPPIDVQRRIADELDELSIQTDRLTDVNERKLAALDELKKSLLHQAFIGQL